MHSTVRRFIKTAIIFLGVGLALGSWMIARREIYNAFPGPYVVSAHTHAIFVGFVMMMILGVALWLFPRPDKADTRYSPTLVEVTYWLVTIGTALRVFGELARSASSSPILRAAVVGSGVLQAIGLLVFFYTMWGRIRGIGSVAREAKGERF